MTRTFNDGLLKYSGDQKLLAKLDELWELNRNSLGVFLHEVPSNYLAMFIKVVEGLLNGMTLVPTKEWKDYRDLSTDTTRRLSYALGYMQDLVDGKRRFSRTALRSWIITLSVPLEGRNTEEVKREVDEAPDMEGDDWLRHGREYFEEFKKHVLSGDTPLNEMPQQVAIGRIEQGLQALGPMFNMMFLFMEQLDGERKEVGQALADFNKDMAALSEKHAPKPPTELLEDKRLRLKLFREEVMPKLSNFMYGLEGSGINSGDMTMEELKVFSACLDVVLRARDNKRR